MIYYRVPMVAEVPKFPSYHRGTKQELRCIMPFHATVTYIMTFLGYPEWHGRRQNAIRSIQLAF